MSKPMVKIYNVSTKEEVEREMTDEEFAQFEADQAEYAARIAAEAEAKAAAEAAEQQKFNDAVAQAVAAALAALQVPQE